MQQPQLSEHIDNDSKHQLQDEDEKSPSCTEEAEQDKEAKEEDDGTQDAERLEVEVVPAPSFLSRLRKVLLMLVALWLMMAILRELSKPRSKVIYANRYSEEYKFRPAASPIVTEHLKDGRIRVRGAEPTARSVPPAKPKPKSKTRKRRSIQQKKAKSGR